MFVSSHSCLWRCCSKLCLQRWGMSDYEQQMLDSPVMKEMALLCWEGQKRESHLLVAVKYANAAPDYEIRPQIAGLNSWYPRSQHQGMPVRLTRSAPLLIAPEQPELAISIIHSQPCICSASCQNSRIKQVYHLKTDTFYSRVLYRSVAWDSHLTFPPLMLSLSVASRGTFIKLWCALISYRYCSVQIRLRFYCPSTCYVNELKPL